MHIYFAKAKKRHITYLILINLNFFNGQEYLIKIAFKYDASYVFMWNHDGKQIKYEVKINTVNQN